jgi:citrate lyase synthetase
LKKDRIEIDDDEFLPDYLVKDAVQFKRNPVSINLPWLINGAPSIDIKTRFMGEQIFSRMKVHKNEVLEHLFKIFRAVLLSA